MNVLLIRPDPGNERFGLGPFFRVEPLGLEHVAAALEDPVIDAIAVDDGEEVLPALADALAAGRPPSSVPALLLRTQRMMKADAYMQEHAEGIRGKPIAANVCGHPVADTLPAHDPKHSTLARAARESTESATAAG